MTIHTNGNVNALRVMAGRDIHKSAHRVRIPVDHAFPSELTSIREYLVAVAEELQLPIEAVALSALAFASSALLGKVEVAPGKNGVSWREIPGIWSAVILPSGSRKSALFTELQAPIAAWEQHESERLRPKITRYAEQRRILEDRLKEARKEASRSESPDAAIALAAELDAMSEVSPPELLVTEATPEALLMQLQRNNGRGLVASPEGDILDIVLGRYSDSRANLGVLLAGHAGDPMKALRVGREKISLSRVLLSVALIVQADALKQAYESKTAVGRGFLARFCVCAPETILGYREINPPVVPEELRERAWTEPLRTLLMWADSPDGNPVVMKFDSEGQALFDSFRASHERRLGPSGDLGQREMDRAWGSKLPGTIARFAGVLQCISEASKGRMSPPKITTTETVQASLAWAEWLIDSNRHAERVALASGEEVDPAELSQKVSELIWANSGELSVRQLQVRMRRQFPRAKLARAALQRFVKDDEGYWKAKPEGAGQKSEVFRFHEADER